MTLFELNHIVRSVLESSLDEEYWVEGEFADASVGFGGHFYGEVVQKDAKGKNIVARARVTCWARNYNIVNLRFQKETGEALRRGLHVKLLVKVTFHEQYGYALNILDVDSSFTLGDMAKRRREILNQLQQDGIINDNKELLLPSLLKHIAVVSSANAAGYGDFCNQLEHNDYGLFFHHHLFPAVMQGSNVEESVMTALAAIADESDRWDCVVIIRGGGATGDLSDFDSYPLAAAVAQMPIPVIVGIGHERDETVLDFVAHTRVKTPTAAAAFLIDNGTQQLARLDDLQNHIMQNVSLMCERQLRRMEQLTVLLTSAPRQRLLTEQHHIQMLQSRYMQSARFMLQNAKLKLENLEARYLTLDPALQLKRGYSLTYTAEGRLLRSSADLHPGDQLITRLADGTVKSEVRR